MFFNLTNCSSQKSSQYLDQNGKEITEEKQRAIFNRNRGGLISATISEGDSIKYQLVPRQEEGRLTPDVNQDLAVYLATIAPAALPKKYLAVIIYYPGKDENNSSGTATRKSYAKWYNAMESKLAKIDGAVPFYVYKDDEGLERQTLGRNWHADRDQLIENTFFKYHYPGGSYTVVDALGNYRSYFGEYSKESVVKTAQQF